MIAFWMLLVAMFLVGSTGKSIALPYRLLLTVPPRAAVLVACTIPNDALIGFMGIGIVCVLSWDATPVATLIGLHILAVVAIVAVLI